VKSGRPYGLTRCPKSTRTQTKDVGTNEASKADAAAVHVKGGRLTASHDIPNLHAHERMKDADTKASKADRLPIDHARQIPTHDTQTPRDSSPLTKSRTNDEQKQQSALAKSQGKATRCSAMNTQMPTHTHTHTRSLTPSLTRSLTHAHTDPDRRTDGHIDRQTDIHIHTRPRHTQAHADSCALMTDMLGDTPMHRQRHHLAQSHMPPSSWATLLHPRASSHGDTMPENTAPHSQLPLQNPRRSSHQTPCSTTNHRSRGG